MSEPMLIYAKMAAILAEFPVVSKDQKNSHFGYKFRGIDDALGHAHGLLGKHGVFLLPRYTECTLEECGNNQVRAVVRGEVAFVTTDGSFVSSGLVGEGIDKGDKALMKAQANALKYAIWYTFCVPTEEMKDSEAFPEPEPVGTTRSKKPVARGNTNVNDLAPYLDQIKQATTLDALRSLVNLVRDGMKDLPPDSHKVLADAIAARKAQLA